MDADAPQRLAYQYARFIDDRSFERLAEIMTADVQITARLFHCDGLSAFVEQVSLLHHYQSTLHLVGNQFGHWEEGVYTGETYCIANHIYDVDGVGWKWEVGVRYQDRIILQDGVALYSHRHLNVLWEQDQPLLAPGARHGQGEISQGKALD